MIKKESNSKNNYTTKQITVTKITMILMLFMIMMMTSACSLQKSSHMDKSKNESVNSSYTIKETNKKIQETLGTKKKLEVIDQSILYNYWHKPNFSKTQKSGRTEKSNFQTLEELYKKAISVDPVNSKYTLGLASVLRSQNKVPEAVEIWNRVLKNDPSNYTALLMRSVYTEFEQNNDKFQNSLNQLSNINKEETDRLKDSFSTIRQVESMSLNHDYKQYTPTGKNRFIVVLGFVLDKKGEIQPTLEQRLKTALRLAKEDNKAKILVSGGKIPQESKVEADVMKDWLISHGISEKRILKEDQSLDTVENALNSSAILKNEQASNVTLVTSASHMRRAYALFDQAKKIEYSLKETPYEINNFVAVDDSKFLSPINEDINEINRISTDVLRINGFWALPEIQR